MKTPNLSLLATGVVAALALAGCSSGGGTPNAAGDAKKTVTIAGVYENTSDAFWGSFICGGKATAKKLGVDLQVSSIPTADNAKLSQTLDTALLTNPEGVIFSQTDSAPWGTKVKSLMSQGTPVITTNADMQNDLTYVTANQDGSKYAGDVAATVKGLTGKAVVMQGLADASWQNQRSDAILASLKKANPDLSWLGNQIDGFDVNKGTQLMSSLITANPDLKVILAVAGPEGQAAAAAVQQTGVKGIKIIAFDSVPAEIQALKAGIISLIIAQPAYKLGGQAVQTMYNFLTDGKYQAGQAVQSNAIEPVTADLGFITPQNVDSPASKDYIYDPNCS
ncbi:sugar ABC transporter substrate-binding protein [Arthrobacter sp. KNU-44]|uniref:sugar ABC transporter substrate-binding protein n=1 Tax=Arthrobacter sp. KNU-44 TaxID=3450744 RepID=UPI003F42610D